MHRIKCIFRDVCKDGKNVKILVAHPQRQHSDKLAAALVKAGHDVTYMTTVYLKRCNLTRLAMGFLSGSNRKRAEGRRNDELPDSLVKQRYEFLGLASLLLLRIDRGRAWYDRLNSWIDRHFGRAVAHRAIRGKYDAVVCYDTHALDCFRALVRNSPDILRILDMSAAALPYQARVFLDDFLIEPIPSMEQKQAMMAMLDGGLSTALLEIALADRFLGASTFARRSLEYSGVPRDSVALCPYGSHFSLADRIGAVHRRMRFVFCGRVSPSKGAHRLFQAFDGIDPETFDLMVVGDYDDNRDFYENYSDRFSFKGGVTREEVRKFYLSSDVFIHPSLTEGMSLACLEALACGLPLLATTNAGANDFIEEGVNGFVVPPSDPETLRDRIQWCIDHPDQVLAMKKNALESAKTITWEAYEESINRAFVKFEAINGQ